MNFEVNSDPPLPTVDIISLMFGQTPTPTSQNPELRRLRPEAATQSEEQLLKAGLLRVLTGGITGSVGRAVEQTLGIDTVQISPSLGTEADPLTPTARLIVGKRLSNRAYLTFSRALGTTTRGEQIIILEYDQSDRLGWVFTQNGANTLRDRLPRAENLLGAKVLGCQGAKVLVLRCWCCAGVLLVRRPACGARPAAAGRGLRRSARRRASRSTIEGRPTTEPALVEALQTKVGAPLKMADVRETITHLYSLGRFDDVRVEAEDARRRRRRAALRAQADSHGDEGRVPRRSSGCRKAMLRDRMTERFGETPPITRAADVAAALRAALPGARLPAARR